MGHTIYCAGDISGSVLRTGPYWHMGNIFCTKDKISVGCMQRKHLTSILWPLEIAKIYFGRALNSTKGEMPWTKLSQVQSPASHIVPWGLPGVILSAELGLNHEHCLVWPPTLTTFCDLLCYLSSIVKTIVSSKNFTYFLQK